MDKKPKVLYVRTNQHGELDCSFSASATVTLAETDEDPEMVREFPTICKLVPVSLASVKRQAVWERAGKRKPKK